MIFGRDSPKWPPTDAAGRWILTVNDLLKYHEGANQGRIRV